MSTARPYLRAFIIGSIWFVAVALKMFSRHSGHWSTFPSFKLLTLGFAWVITALLVGVVITRFERLRSWWIVSLGTVFGSLFVLWTMLVTIEALYKPPFNPRFENTNEMMAYFATETAKWVKADRGIDLDYSVDSIQIIEEELARISGQIDRTNPPPGTLGTAMGYGAYVGEVMRRRDGGSWADDHPTGGPKSYPLAIKSNLVVFPVGWTWRRLINGEEDNVYHKVLLFDSAGDVLSFATNHANGIYVSPPLTNSSAK